MKFKYHACDHAYSDPIVDAKSRKVFSRFNCFRCDKKITDASQLTQHICTGEASFSCSNCDKKFTKQQSLQIHERTKQFSCPICKRKFSNCKTLKIHERSHSGNNAKYRHMEKCWKCGEKFRNSEALKIHEKTHEGGQSFICPICEKRFDTPTGLKIHETHKHRPAVPGLKTKAKVFSVNPTLGVTLKELAPSWTADNL